MRQQQPIWPNFRFTDHVTLQINYAQACDIARLDMILPFQTCFSFRMLPVHNISSFVVGPGLSYALSVGRPCLSSTRRLLWCRVDSLLFMQSILQIFRTAHLAYTRIVIVRTYTWFCIHPHLTGQLAYIVNFEACLIPTHSLLRGFIFNSKLIVLITASSI